MDVEKASLSFLFSETKMEVPFFQRPYVWKYENVKTLYQDLIDNFVEHDRTHFLGSILLKLENNKDTDSRSKDVIIDGQQRLTTLTIMTKVMYDILQENKLFNPIEASQAILALWYSSGTTEIKPHIEHSYLDTKKYLEIIGDPNNSPMKDTALKEIKEETTLSEDKYEKKYNESSNLLKECYKFFLKNLSQLAPEKIKKLWNKLYNGPQNIFVIIMLNDNEREQEIFDTINSAGLSLTSTDIIKNSLYEKLISSGESRENALNFYKETWQETFESEENYAFWSKKRNVGRNLRDNMELFFQAYGIIHEPPIFNVEEDTLSDLADKFKKYLDNFSSPQDIKKFIHDLMKTADVYKSMPKFSNSEQIRFEDIDKRVACIMEVSDNTTFTPYLLYIYKNYQNDTTKLLSRLKLIDNILMHYIISGNSNKNFNKYCYWLIDNDKKGDKDLTNYVMTNLNDISAEDLRNGISYKKNNTLAKLILYFIELSRLSSHNKSDSQYHGIVFSNEMELEHILPKKWEENWKNVPFIKDDSTNISDYGEGKSYRNEKLYSLGNMTILPKKLNTSISNSAFYKKIQGSQDKKGKKLEGVREHSTFSITTEFLPNKTAPESDYIWNEKTIIERESKLFNEILTIWPIS